MVMVSAQNRMGIFSFESNRIYTSVSSPKPFPASGFFSCWRPTSRVALWSKNPSKKKRKFALRVVNSGGGVLEKEFEFKPSFDEYLKTMESVREKKQSFKSNRGKSSRNFGENENMSKIEHNDVKMKSEGVVRARSKKALLVKSEDDDVKALRDNPQVSRIQTEERTKESAKLRKCDSNSESYEDNVNLIKFGGFSKEVKMSKVFKYNEVNSKNEGIRRTRSRKGFVEEGEDDDLKIERTAFKNFEEYNDIVNKPRVSKMEMEERIQKLAKSLNGADIDMPEWMFSKMMRSAKIKFSDYCILRVIQVLGKLGNWRRVLQVIEWLEVRERFKSHRLRHIYTTALDVLGKARRPVEALNLFRSMQVLNACARRKQWEGAFWVLQQLKQQHLLPSTTTYGLVMEVMFECGKYNLVHEFFRKMDKSCIPNALTYRVLVNTLWKEDRIDEAVSVVQVMEKRGIVGSAALYYDLARCLCSAGRCQEALMQIEKICKVANKPLVVTYTGLIQACLDSGNIENGAYIFNQMQKYCSPNLVTCNIMLKAYLDHGLFDEAKELFQKMSKDANENSSKCNDLNGVVADSYTFNIMLDACVQRNRWDEFEHVYRRMLRHGFHFNAKRHLRMILDAARAGKGELLETTWEEMDRAERTPPLPLIKERFCMKLEKNDYASAVSCITIHPASELQALSKSVWLNLYKDNASRFQQETIIGLVEAVDMIIGKSESPNPVLDNLLASSKQILRTGLV
ncbi:hypothetical protein ES332_D10G320800v1 [Gossypium tomentosum]|uniref:Pentacotripeptide-repeat region of PRORP domain-containing protein n=1 Tax=Gossypium tomentosum TaxID=34277 RepID=A0A5D2JC65_GOSTO|nr:hypothetical protein ES332_D10G320800v1 [Gossypium tomentosum]